MINSPEKGFEKPPTAYEIFKSAFPVHENFNWFMPDFDDPKFVEKIGDAPIWGNKFREDDVATIIDSLNELGFDTLIVATRLLDLYEKSGGPQVEKDMKDNAIGKEWSGLITSLLHIATTDLYQKKGGSYAAKPLIPGLVLTPEQRSLPLEDRQGLQNNIAAEILMVGDKELEDLKPQAKKVVALFQNANKTEAERQEMLAEKLALEKAYFQKKFPEFFTDSVEDRPEAPLEEFQEMIDQIPILREMLREAEEELLALMKNPVTSKSLIEEVKVQIENLKEEISNREDLIS